MPPTPLQRGWVRQYQQVNHHHVPLCIDSIFDILWSYVHIYIYIYVDLDTRTAGNKLSFRLLDEKLVVSRKVDVVHILKTHQIQSSDVPSGFGGQSSHHQSTQERQFSKHSNITIIFKALLPKGVRSGPNFQQRCEADAGIIADAMVARCVPLPFCSARGCNLVGLLAVAAPNALNILKISMAHESTIGT